MDPLLNIVLLGPPGSGKGTQAIFIKDRYQLVHLSTGELFRQEIANKTEIGIEAQKLIEEGHLCADGITLNILNKNIALQNNPKGFVFDGVPRTIEQAEMMDGIDYSPVVPVTMVINIAVDKEEILARIMKRSELENRSDDNWQVAQTRIANYYALTEPLIAYYQAQNKLIQVDGMQSIEEVSHDIARQIDDFLRRGKLFLL